MKILDHVPSIWALFCVTKKGFIHKLRWTVCQIARSTKTILFANLSETNRLINALWGFGQVEFIEPSLAILSSLNLVRLRWVYWPDLWKWADSVINLLTYSCTPSAARDWKFGPICAAPPASMTSMSDNMGSIILRVWSNDYYEKDSSEWVRKTKSRGPKLEVQP